MVQNEAQLWKYLKNKTPRIEWTKIENTSHFGTPDLLGYNKNKIEKNFMSFDENYKPHINIEMINKEIKKNSSKNIDPLDLAYISNIIQNDTNNYVLNLLKEFIKKTDKAIYLSGGVMLNIKLKSIR